MGEPVLTLICSDKEGRSHWITLIVVRDRDSWEFEQYPVDH